MGPGQRVSSEAEALQSSPLLSTLSQGHTVDHRTPPALDTTLQGGIGGIIAPILKLTKLGPVASILTVKGPDHGETGVGCRREAVPGPSSLTTGAPFGGVGVEVHPCSVREAPCLLWGHLCLWIICALTPHGGLSPRRGNRGAWVGGAGSGQRAQCQGQGLRIPRAWPGIQVCSLAAV